eukprot:11098078-Ditylum_brightwellii.AAC.1
MEDQKLCAPAYFLPNSKVHFCLLLLQLFPTSSILPMSNVAVLIGIYCIPLPYQYSRRFLPGIKLQNVTFLCWYYCNNRRRSTNFRIGYHKEQGQDKWSHPEYDANDIKLLNISIDVDTPLDVIGLIELLLSIIFTGFTHNEPFVAIDTLLSAL